jgi:type I restriction-modification system DNA methylase subunit
MSEELIQRNLIEAPEAMGPWKFYNIGATSLKSLKEANIIPNRDYEEYEKKKPDTLIIKRPHIIAAIEYKQPKELRTQKQIEAAILHQLGTARVLGAKIYIVTDGKKTIWLNPLTGNEITSENGSRIDLTFNQNNVECIKLLNKAIFSINSKNDKLLESTIVDPLPLAQKIWQDLWAVSGATPENCLYTFVELFIFKYLSDLGVLTGLHSFSNLLNQYKTNTESEVLEYYADSIRKKIKELFPLNPKDNTTIINGTIFISKDDKAVSGYATVFKKILERFNSFGTLENIDYDFKSKLFETFLKESISKKNWGQFFTPLKVVRAVVRMADINTGMKICDPFCGVGKFLLEPILHEIHKYFRVENNELRPQLTLSGYDKGFDKDEQKTIILAKANMLIYMSSLVREHVNITKQFSDLFNETFLLQTNSILGTLANPVTDEYDLILTNPPYVMSGSSNLKDEIAKRTPEEVINKQKSLLEQHYSVNAMGVEGLSMEWIIRSLKPGGKAFVIVPDGIMNRSNDKRLREFILEECNIDAIISLPLNTFFTTNKKTYIMALTKKISVLSSGISTKECQTTPVFTYLCSEIGETRDVNRFDIHQNDLEAATTLFNIYKGVRSTLPIEDKRCKIVSIDKFYTNTHWSIERWWTREEKIELGIEEEIDFVSLEDFISIVDDTATTLIEFEEPLRELAKKKPEFIGKKSISLGDNQLFDLFIGKRLLKKDFFYSKGSIPAYSANVFSPFVYVEESNITDFSAPFIVWGIDGDFKFNVIEANKVFTITDHCGAIRVKNSHINPYYLAYMLEQTKHVYGFDRGLRASLTNMKKIEISLPIDEMGNFDLKAQQGVAEQITFFTDMLNELSQKKSDIASCNVVIDLKDYSMREFTLDELLDPVRGKSKYTKRYGDTNKGIYPVYSASANKPLTSIDTFDYNGSYLSWSTNGFAGNVSILTDRFSINGDRGVLLPKREDIDIQYLRYLLQPIFRRLAKGRRGDRGTDEFTKLYPSMIVDVKIHLPINEDGSVSIEAQKEIAQTYRAVDDYKYDILTKLCVIQEQKVSF